MPEMPSCISEQAWRRARSSLMTQLGDAINDASKLDAKAKQMFDEIDTDKNGSIDHTELKTAMERAGVMLKNKEVHSMLIEADEDG